MAKTSIFEPLFDDGLASINFFNGRLLSAEDLKTERTANREGHRRLARAIGGGVVYGLEVRTADGSSASAPAVTVTAGLAVNRTGDTIRLEQDTEVSLLTAQTGDGTTVTRVFHDCVPPRVGSYDPGAGAYLLTISSAKGGRGLAPVSGLGNEQAGCNLRYLVEGVEFRMTAIPEGLEINSPQRLRNLLAYRFFDAPPADGSVWDPQQSAADTLIETLTAIGSLTSCDVPLALVYWTAAGIRFVEMWVVRRPAARANEGSRNWELSLEPRRLRAGEARFRQFQSHVQDLRFELAQPHLARATDHFRYLPAAGLLPLGNIRLYERRLAPPPGMALFGFDYERFFAGRALAEPVFLDRARVPALLRDSFQYAPIDVEAKDMFWLYFIRESIQPIDNRQPAQPYLLFAHGHMRFYAEARFNLSLWDYSNYM